MASPNTADTIGNWDPPYIQPSPTWPTYSPPQTVWVYPPQFWGQPSWEAAAQKAYEAMEAYYRALTAALTSGSEDAEEGSSSEPAAVLQGGTDA